MSNKHPQYGKKGTENSHVAVKKNIEKDSQKKQASAAAQPASENKDLKDFLQDRLNKPESPLW
jgi:hypothetical protein